MRLKFRMEIIAGMFGLLYFVLIFPIWLLNPNNASWVWGNETAVRDSAAHALGQSYFLHENWSFPLIGSIKSFGYYENSLLYVDANPFITIIFKLYSSFFPINGITQLLGIQILIGAVLLGVFGYLLTFEFHKNQIIAISAAIFMLSSSAFVTRWWNGSLEQQWIIVASLWGFMHYFQSVKVETAFWTSLIAIATATNTYWLVIVFVFSIANLIPTKNQKNLSWRHGILYFVTYLVTNYVIGGSQIPINQLGASSEDAKLFSASPLSFLNSKNYGFFNVLDKVDSWEGFNYLGAGAIILLIIYSIEKVSNLTNFSYEFNLNKFPSKKLLIFATAVVLWILSWGPEWRFLHLSLEVSNSLVNPFWELFRGTARFALPLMYLLIAEAFFALNKFKSKSTLVLMCFLITFIQVMDQQKLLLQTKNVASSSFTNTASLQIPAERIENLIVVPAFSGTADGMPWRKWTSIAREKNASSNYWGYIARMNQSKAGQIMEKTDADLRNCELKVNSVYLINPEFKTVYAPCLATMKLLASDLGWGAYYSGTSEVSYLK